MKEECSNYVTAGRIRTVTGMCVVALVKHIMQKENLPPADAYSRLMDTELYNLLTDPDARLYLETNAFLQTALDIEKETGPDSMYAFINS